MVRVPDAHQGAVRFRYDRGTVCRPIVSWLGIASARRKAARGHRPYRERFDDEQISFFGVLTDARDHARPIVADSIPGIRFFWDLDRSVSMLYGVAPGKSQYRLTTYVLDPALRVLAVIPNKDDAHCAQLLSVLDRLPRIGPSALAAQQAPVLAVPTIFEPSLCKELIDYYERLGGQDLGFARDVGGKTTRIIDHDHKRRGDRIVEDEALCHACMIRIRDRLAPEVHKAFQVRTTRMERHLVSCYDTQDGGHFRPHRDNTTRGTAHRQFAVSLFLNSGEYEGGFLRFPEFGPALYSAPTGGAVVFSCSLLHEATRVTRGRRYMFLPFLYDEAGHALRERNRKYLDVRITEAPANGA
jgi:predicted 2-oxoglutarate/Fe(II)-dependent dioxygenase YbiX